MHNGMSYDPIQGQDQGHGASEVSKIAVLTACCFASAVLATAIPSVRPSVRPSVCLSVRHTLVLCQNDGT